LKRLQALADLPDIVEPLAVVAVRPDAGRELDAGLLQALLYTRFSARRKTQPGSR